MPGTKETKELLGWALDTALEGKDIWANKKFDMGDIDNLWRILKSAPSAFKDADQIIVEFWDYDEVERAELAAFISEKLAPWGLPPEMIAQAAELILHALIANAKVVKFFADLKQAEAAENDSTKIHEPQT